MLKLLLFSMLLLVRPSPQQQPVTPATPAIPPDAMQRTRPAKPTPEGMVHAKKMYGYDCEVCHGATGNGKGDLAVQSKLPMKDWTDPAVLKGRTDGELFYIITNGEGDMPAEGNRAKPEDIWNMVAILRSFSKS
jgi:mono/diheme cytochrome c family protein